MHKTHTAQMPLIPTVRGEDQQHICYKEFTQ